MKKLFLAIALIGAMAVTSCGGSESLTEQASNMTVEQLQQKKAELEEELSNTEDPMKRASLSGEIQILREELEKQGAM